VKLSLVFLILCFTAVCRAQDTSKSPQSAASFPELSLSQAISLADEYTRANNIDLSTQYMHSAQLSYDGGQHRKGAYWRIRWMSKRPHLGGDFGVRVYMDKFIVPEIAGP